MKVSRNFALVLAIVLLEGFVSIAVEILTMRQLLPVVGTTVITNSLVIGIFLLALALGYYRGGRYSGNRVVRLLRNFTFASIWLGLGLSYVLMIWWFKHVPSLGIGNFGPLLLYLLVVTAPLVYWLGQTIPLSIGLLDDHESASRLSGSVLALSTMGSFLGAVLTSLILLNFIGVAWSVWLCGFVLALLALAIVATQQQYIIYLLPLLIVSVLSYWVNPLMEQKLFMLTDNYANYNVVQATPRGSLTGKMLMLNGSYMSFTNVLGQSFAYADFIQNFVFNDLKLRHGSILILGAGGFTLTQDGTHTNQVTYVDINPHLKRFVEKHFLPKIHGKFVHADARHYLLTTHKKYNVIISDLFTNQKVTPTAVLTQQFFEQMQHHTKKGGYVIMNMLMNGRFSDKFSQHLDNTIRSVFQHCLVVPIYYNDGQDNVIYMCRVLHSDRQLYTDDLNRIALDQISDPDVSN